MQVFTDATGLKRFLDHKRKDGSRVGFVPTMGALHEGHLSLIWRSKAENALTVCSIYVNPAQFNDPKDLEKYPRPIEHDMKLLESAGCDVLFFPSTEEMYPGGLHNLADYDLNGLENYLEGASRPGHFKGVANVVDRLLKMVEPQRLYLGQKDFQQVKVIEAGLRNPGFGNRDVEVVMCDIIREEDGLAMSSRNVRLNPVQRKNAAGISRELFFIRDHWKEFEPAMLKLDAIRRINSIPEAQVDYLEFCDAERFTLLNGWDEAAHVVCVTSVIVGGVRLLDNVMLK